MVGRNTDLGQGPLFRPRNLWMDKPVQYVEKSGRQGVEVRLRSWQLLDFLFNNLMDHAFNFLGCLLAGNFGF